MAHSHMREIEAETSKARLFTCSQQPLIWAVRAKAVSLRFAMERVGWSFPGSYPRDRAMCLWSGMVRQPMAARTTQTSRRS